MSDVTVVDADDPAFEDAVAIRERVFVEEQGVPEERELDGKDGEATHFLLRVGGDPVGTARLRTYETGAARTAADRPSGDRNADESASGSESRGDVGKVERVAVLPACRGAGHGEAIMDALESYAAEAGFVRLVLDAQTQVVEFYEQLGYAVEDDEPFVDAGIPHRRMGKRL